MIVHRIVIEKEAMDKVSEEHYVEFIKQQWAEGEAVVKRLVPDAVHRVGCTCCYGDGPDITYDWPKEQEDGSFVIEFDVDYDFVPPPDQGI